MYRGLDIHLRGRHGTLSTSCHTGVSRVLGGPHAKPNACGESAERDQETAARVGYGISRSRRMCHPALGTIAATLVRRDSIDWIVLWSDFPDHTGDCG